MVFMHQTFGNPCLLKCLARNHVATGAPSVYQCLSALAVCCRAGAGGAAAWLPLPELPPTSGSPHQACVDWLQQGECL